MYLLLQLGANPSFRAQSRARVHHLLSSLLQQLKVRHRLVAAVVKTEPLSGTVNTHTQLPHAPAERWP